MGLSYVSIIFFILVDVAPSNISQCAAFWTVRKKEKKNTTQKVILSYVKSSIDVFLAY